MTPTVLLVAKAPVAGRSKTRLSPPLTPEQAASLQRALLLDTLDACRAEVPETGLLHAEEAEAPVLAELAGPGTRRCCKPSQTARATSSCALSRRGSPVAA